MGLPEDIAEFRRLCDLHGTDKGHRQRYEEVYARFLEPFRHRGQVRLLEIGIYQGASLRVWQDWFDDVELYAVDIDRRCKRHAPSGTTVFVGNQGKEEFWRETLPKLPSQLDIVVDDGSHRPRHQMLTFEKLWPRVAPGGLYVIEDLHMSKRFRRQERQRQGKQAMSPTTLGWLFERIRRSVKSRAYRRAPSIMAFAGCACFITKPGSR